MGPVVLVPKSKGTVSLSSSNPMDKAIIDPKYFSDDDDLRKSVIGFKLAQKLATTKAFKPYYSAPFEPSQILHDDSAIKDHLRKTSETLYHPVGTCKMGTDRMSVVDSQLRVHGIQGLRVVDASVMPTITRGNTNAPTIMIAERAADLILQAKNAKAARATA